MAARLVARHNMSTPAPDYLAATRFVDHEAPEIRAFNARALAHTDTSDARQTTIALFNAVRDQLRYDPYRFLPDAETFTASHIVQQPSGFCVPKAVLLAACLRAAGIPAALGFADVKNHLNSPKLAALMQTDTFIYHGYVQVWLGEQTFKITPAFDSAMCERFGVKPLVFDGTADALFHEFDQQSRRHMEYVHDRGLFEDLPFEDMMRDFRALYPKLIAMSLERQARQGSADPAFRPDE